MASAVLTIFIPVLTSGHETIQTNDTCGYECI